MPHILVRIYIKFKLYCCINACQKSTYILEENNTGKMVKQYGKVHEQLEMFHNPFSRATTQPKIPDGKTVESLGFHTEAVGEVVNSEDQPIMHMLMYAGQKSALIIDKVGGLSTRTYTIPDFQASGGINWTTLLVDPPIQAAIGQIEPYANWRTVSAGLRLALLNPSEENDGWWEAVRVTEPLDASDWYYTTTGVSNVPANNGTIAPLDLIDQFASKEIVNERSYVTGLLRELEDYQFELHGVKDHHDFTTGKEQIHISPESRYAADIPNKEVRMQNGFQESFDVIESNVDQGYDMIYIRFHCRKNDGSAGDQALQGSRIHYNLVSNQEIVYGIDRKESRFQTQTGNVGVDASSKHASLRRMRGSAAHKLR
jgi:hypothetical protein